MSLERSMSPWCIAGVLCLSGLAGCSNDKPPAVAALPEVTVVQVEAKELPTAGHFVGQTQSSRQVRIVSRVNGFLEKRLYEEGAFVKVGQPLYRIDDKPFMAQLQSAKAALAQQDAGLTVARANLARIKPLAEKNAVSQKDLDQAIGQEKQAAALVESAKANVMQAELNVGYTRINSPVAGVTSFSQIAEGSYVTANNQLTYVAQISPMWVSFSVSENQMLATMGRAERGQLNLPANDQLEVELRLADGSVFPEKGRITFGDAEFNTQTGTYLVRATFANQEGRLRPGQFVSLRILGATLPAAIAIPQRAVMQAPNGHFVWTLDKEGKTGYRPVVVGNLSGDDWVIERGLQAGDTVVVDGGMMLRPGIPVKAVPLTKNAAPAGKPAESAGQAPPADKR